MKGISECELKESVKSLSVYECGVTVAEARSMIDTYDCSIQDSDDKNSLDPLTD